MLRLHAFALSACLLVPGCNCSEEPEVGEPAAEEERPPEESAPPGLLWVTIDTLRADHLSAYGYARETSPRLTGLAAEGALFENASVQGMWTFQSVPSIMTSEWAQQYVLHWEGERPVSHPPPDADWIPERLRQEGYRTVLVTGHGVLDGVLGLCERFDECQIGDWPAEEVTRRALEVFRAHRGERPLFLWAYYLDPHFPYEAPPPFDSQFVGDGLVVTGLSAGPGERIWVGRGGLPQRAVVDGRTDLDWYIARYDGEIAYADREVGRLVDGYREAGVLDETVFMLFADHGHSLIEHDLYLSHAEQVYDTIMQIPWVVRYPPVVQADRRVEAQVMAVDIAPTTFGLLGLEAPERWVGTDQTPCLRGGECASRPAFGISYTLGGNEIAIREPPHKLICDAALEGCRLYDLEADPGELTDVADANEAVVARLRPILAAWIRDNPPRHLDPAAAEQLSEETLEGLRALGYIE